MSEQICLATSGSTTSVVFALISKLLQFLERLCQDGQDLIRCTGFFECVQCASFHLLNSGSLCANMSETLLPR